MKFFKRATEYMELTGRVRTMQVLRQLSERQLVDAGISPDLLSLGVKAWPWRVEDEPAPVALKLESLKPVTVQTRPAANAPHVGLGYTTCK